MTKAYWISLYTKIDDQEKLQSVKCCNAQIEILNLLNIINTIKTIIKKRNENKKTSYASGNNWRWSIWFALISNFNAF